MDKNTIYQTTEWEWFKLQLRLYAMESQSPKWRIFFDFCPKKDSICENNNVEITCQIFNLSMDEILDFTSDKEKLLKEFFNGWIETVKETILKILKGIPVLEKDFDLEQHISFEIMRDYGMGSYVICTFIGNKVLWNNVFSSSYKE